MNDKPQKVAADLAGIVRGDVFADILHRAAFGSDASIYRIVPLCVVAPRDSADVVGVVKYAACHNIPIAGRGAGSGVAGESLCSGIVVDMTRYMNRILEVAEDGSSVVCEPGVVLNELNNRLAEYGRGIGPDPSSGNRATIGGCVANNATGAHWLEYGYTGDYVESIEAVLADGSLVEFKNDFDPVTAADDRVASIARDCLAALSDKGQIIEKSLPKTRRNRSGYTIGRICHDGKVDLARLMGGSEGTLGIFTKITLRTVAVRGAKGLLELRFDSLEKMGRAVPIIVNSGACACELIDKKLIDMAADALPEYRDILPADAAAVLMVEHKGQTRQQVEDKIAATDSAVGALASGRKVVLDDGGQKRLWKLRKDAVPLLSRKKGRKRPAAFIEDISVENTRLGECISGLEEIGKRFDIEMSFYGHAGDSVLHIRPYLDLGDRAEVEKMRAIADEVFSLVWSLGGSVSGEHADGLVRAAFIKQQYGNEYYELLCKIKNIFDPDGLMNPGKIINSDADVMVRNLRAKDKILPARLASDLLFEKDELEFELGQCSGCGLCLSKEADLRMCPVYRAMGEELGSSRAKANILGLWARGLLDEKDFESQEFKKFLSLCINCKACSVQCPTGVDISKLITAVRTEYAKRKGLTRAELALSHNRLLSAMGSIFRPVSNAVSRLAVFKWFLEKAAGLDRHRDMPGFEAGGFLAKGQKFLANCEPIKEPIDKVAYFVDTYANYNDHELGFAVIGVLRHNNIEVALPKQRPVPLPAIVYGDVKTAKKDLSYNVRQLAGLVRNGYKIVCSEPSAALCLRQELRHFVTGDDGRLISENTFELMGYLWQLYSQGKLKPAANSVGDDFVYHCPCHLLAMGGSRSIELLERLCGVGIVDLNAGCCGLAGTFGMQKKNYELSSQIAAGLAKAMESGPTKNVLTECAACKMQIEHISDARVSHPIKIIAESYGIIKTN